MAKLLMVTIQLFLVSIPILLSVSEQAVNQLTADRACQKCDLKQADLRSMDLHQADLRGANLDNAMLYKIDLKGAQLEGALGIAYWYAINIILTEYSS
ncbi:MAG: pentapeptide repeat-containing protein [Candidatus Thiodiazotropha sp. (ex Lucinoma borealis)]|nr:pentapeptide repeat-containing protein [Candidatus Thiodiazotropha sp. (ex Lucinoma borealis)]